MDSNEREYWIDIYNRCVRKYEYLVDRLALSQSEKMCKKEKEVKVQEKRRFIGMQDVV